MPAPRREGAPDHRRLAAHRALSRVYPGALRAGGIRRVDAEKVSDHHVRSPLLNINRACQTCHKASEKALLARVEAIQGRHYGMMSRRWTR